MKLQSKIRKCSIYCTLLVVTNVSMCAYVYVCVADEQGYTLRDAEAEVLFGFSLEESLKRANSVPLFKVKLASL